MSAGDAVRMGLRTKPSSACRRLLEVECPNIAAIPQDFSAVDIEEMRFSQAYNFSLFTVEESLVEDLFQLLLFELLDLSSSFEWST